MNIIVSMQKMNACMKLPNQSKYKEMTAGMPTVKERNGAQATAQQRRE